MVILPFRWSLEIVEYPPIKHLILNVKIADLQKIDWKINIIELSMSFHTGHFKCHLKWSMRPTVWTVKKNVFIRKKRVVFRHVGKAISLVGVCLAWPAKYCKSSENSKIDLWKQSLHNKREYDQRNSPNVVISKEMRISQKIRIWGYMYRSSMKLLTSFGSKFWILLQIVLREFM